MLKKKYGVTGQLSLSYDMTFFVILLTGVYEPKEKIGSERCVIHPMVKHHYRFNKYTEYVVDMNLLLSYYKCLDDWDDEKKISRKFYADCISRKTSKVAKKYKEKSKKIIYLLKEIKELEVNNVTNIDIMAGKFGNVMAEIFAYRDDEWKEQLRKIGYYLGFFVYVMDAYDDIEDDIEKNCYNPFVDKYKEKGFAEWIKQILTMAVAECAVEFEKLPILLNVELLRNILYSGIWTRYESITAKRNKDINLGERKG